MGILVKNIFKKFGDFIAVDQVSFNINTGELVGLLGPSGSGKSTLLRIIAGLEIPDEGEIYLTGKDVTSMSIQKRKVGFVFQHYALFKHMTAKKNISFGLEITKQKKEYIKEKVEELISLVKLHGYENHYPDQLSGGQRQRVALARALATEPNILLLDEPFGSLDAKVRENLSDWLREFHNKLNITSIFVTHDQNEAMEISDRIIVINRGRVEQMGSPREVYEHPKTKFVASFIGQINVIDAVIKNDQIFLKGTNYMFKNTNSVLSNSEDVILLVRPEDIELSTKNDSEQLINAKIKRIHYCGSHYEIYCAINELNLRVVENKDNLQSKNWQKDQTVSLIFKSFKIFEASNGHKSIHDKLKDLGYIE